MTTSLKQHIDLEIAAAEAFLSKRDADAAFPHLERAHVLAQARTGDHTRIHVKMLKAGWMRRDPREVFGQLIRIVGAATKTPFGIYPRGNTGGANVFFFKKMQVPEDLQSILDQSK